MISVPPTTWRGHLRLPHRPSSRFAPLDGYRAVAALLVVVHHVAGRNALIFEKTVMGKTLMAFGNMGVAIFFVLSGFLLYRPFVERDLLGRPAPALGRYATNRLLRILPAYWVALTAAFVLVAKYRESFGDPLTGGQYASFYALVQNYQARLAFSGLPVAWTLGIELTFYLALPVLALGARAVGRAVARTRAGRAGVHLVLLALLFAGAFLFRHFVVFNHQGLADSERFWLFGYLDWFALGMLLALGVAWRAAGGRLPRVIETAACSTTLCWVAAVAVFFISVPAVRVDLQVDETMVQLQGRYLWHGLAAFLIALPVTIGANRGDPLHRLFRTRPLLFLGTISYGLYLWHIIVIDRLDGTNWWKQQVERHHFGLTFAVVVGVTLVLATISWYAIEHTALRLKRRSTDPAEPHNAPMTSPPALPAPGGMAPGRPPSAGAPPDRDVPADDERIVAARAGARFD